MTTMSPQIFSAQDPDLQFRRFVRGLLAAGKERGAVGIRLMDDRHLNAFGNALGRLKDEFSTNIGGTKGDHFPRTFPGTTTTLREKFNAELFRLADSRQVEPWLVPDREDLRRPLLKLNMEKSLQNNTLSSYTGGELKILRSAALAFDAFVIPGTRTAPSKPGSASARISKTWRSGPD